MAHLQHFSNTILKGHLNMSRTNGTGLPVFVVGGDESDLMRLLGLEQRSYPFLPRKPAKPAVDATQQSAQTLRTKLADAANSGNFIMFLKNARCLAALNLEGRQVLRVLPKHDQAVIKANIATWAASGDLGELNLSFTLHLPQSKKKRKR